MTRLLLHPISRSWHDGALVFFCSFFYYILCIRYPRNAVTHYCHARLHIRAIKPLMAILSFSFFVVLFVLILGAVSLCERRRFGSAFINSHKLIPLYFSTVCLLFSWL